MDAAAAAPPQAPTLTPAAHLRLALLRCVLALVLRASRRLAPLPELLPRFPALQPWLDAAATSGLEGCTLEAAIQALDERLGQGQGELPLARLRAALALDAGGLDVFLLCALAAEDPGLGPLIDALRGHEGRITHASLASDDGGVAPALAPLLACGFLVEQATGRWRTLEVPDAVWQAAQGRSARLTPPEDLPRWADLILPPQLQEAARSAQALHPPHALCWALRGRAGSGRRALAGALARSAGLGLLEAQADDDPLRLAACATLLGAMPLLELAPAPGERAMLPPLPGLAAPIAVRLPPLGGLGSTGRLLQTLELAIPPPQERQRHWAAALGTETFDPALVDLRLPRGRIHALASRVGGDAARVVAEVDAQGRWLLDGLAQRVPPLAPQECLAVDPALQEEFDLLLARCRHREALPGLLPAAFGAGGGAGVRALFKGPSGTGKTLAARQLAAALARPLYRVDLAATVSKYIGETERNLERVFAAAEALDIVLLLDEGDALMAGRTNVANANDRYANLETNYLLQRLEHYDGILLVTTNAGERIDAAFARRMDATLEFGLPDAQTRHRLWCAHLPPQQAIAPAALDEVALRCVLSGGQIRNAALQATLLALEQGGAPCEEALAAALQREYRRAGQACPSLSWVDPS